MRADPTYTADVVRRLRGLRGFTQENLADAAHLSTRTIEKIESGRHGSQEETLRRIAKVFGADNDIFKKPTAEELSHLQRGVEKEIRKSVLVALHPVVGANDILDFGPCHALERDTSAVVDEVALAAAAELMDVFHDLMDLWNDIPMAEQTDMAIRMLRLCEVLSEAGYRCHLGHYRMIQRSGKAVDLVLRVAVVSVRPADDPAQRLLVRLSGPWEGHPDDRPATPLWSPDVALN